jgi:hypothetical protein
MAFWSAGEVLSCRKRMHLGLGSSIGSLLCTARKLESFAFAHRERGFCSFCNIQERHRLVIGSNQADSVLTFCSFRLFTLFEDAFSFP